MPNPRQPLRDDPSVPAPRARRPRRRRPGAAALLALLVFGCVAAFAVSRGVFVVRAITIHGNRILTAQQVADASGILPGDSMFGINDFAVASRINQNQYLVFVSLVREFPSRVVLTVEERSPRAAVLWMGKLILLGEGGVVLEKNDLADTQLAIPYVTGVEDVSAREGAPVSFGLPGRFDAYCAIMDELDAQQVAGEISELNLRDLDNLYLVTTDGLQILLGNDGNMAEKIRHVRAVAPMLRTIEEVRGAVLDVSTGEAADFSPG